MASGFGAGDGIGVDTRDLKAFITATRKASRVAATEIRTQLLAAGEIVAVEARSIAEKHSTSIPPTIQAKARGASVSVAASGTVIGGLYELGNRGQGRNISSTGTFRHRVFGHDVWVDQPRYAFLRPAAENKMPEVEAAILKVADDMVNVLRTK